MSATLDRILASRQLSPTARRILARRSQSQEEEAPPTINVGMPQLGQQRVSALGESTSPSNWLRMITGKPEEQGIGENLLRDIPATLLQPAALAEQTMRDPLGTVKGIGAGLIHDVGHYGKLALRGAAPASNVFPEAHIEEMQRLKEHPLQETMNVAGIAAAPMALSATARRIFATKKVPQVSRGIAEPTELGTFGTPTALKEFTTGTSPLNKWWEAQVDKGLAAAGKIVPKPVKKALVYGYGKPKEWLAAQQEKKLRTSTGLEEVKQISKEASKVLPETSYREASKYLDPTLGEIVPPSKVSSLSTQELKSLDKIRENITKMGNEAVDAGILTEETRAANEATYLSRRYAKYESPASNATKRAFAKLRIGKQRARKLETLEQREKAGIIYDPVYSYAKKAMVLRHDIETARLFKTVAESPQFAKYVGNKAQAGFASTPVPNRPEFGALRGKFVDQGIYDDLMAMQKAWDKGLISRLYDKTLSGWKFLKTAGNPATHGRNIFSSVMQADAIGGLSPARVDIWTKSILDIRKKAPEFLEFKGLGGVEGTWYESEIGSVFNRFSTSKGSMVERAFDMLAQSKWTKPVTVPLKFAGKAYRAEETWARYSVYKYRKSLGETPRQAIKVAKKAVPDYSEVPEFIAKTRKYAVPFISYPYKILPQLVESALKHPIRIGKYIALFKAINEFSKSNLGMSDEEYEKLKGTRQFGSLSSVLLPSKDRNGRYAVFDLTYNVPWGDILEFGGSGGKIKEHAWAMMNPFIKSPMELTFNKNLFTGRPIYGQVDKGKDIAGYLYGQAAPTIAGVGAKALLEMVTGKGNYYGEKRMPAQTIGKYVLGAKVEPVNIERELSYQKGDIRKQTEELETKMGNIMRDTRISDKEKALAPYRKRRQDLIDAYRKL